MKKLIIALACVFILSTGTTVGATSISPMHYTDPSGGGSG
jgi:hypothetical protein